MLTLFGSFGLEKITSSGKYADVSTLYRVQKGTVE